jgi:hypothetical protein
MPSTLTKFSLVLVLCVVGASATAQTERPRQHLAEASAELQEALAQQTSGAEPLPGERIGTVRRQRSRLSEAYFARQKVLAARVAQARAALERARQVLAAARDTSD